MSWSRWSLILFVFLHAGWAAWAQQVDVQEKRFPNGMKLLMLPRAGEASVAGGWVTHAGSSNERPGITGIAHLFEHMMFKGTTNLGTKDYARDVAIIAEQEQVREQMRQEEAKMRDAYRRGEIDDMLKPENKTERLRELEKRFAQLIEDQRSILVKNEFDRIYTTAGASGMNAFTTHDMTGYFITVPANKLELWMWMESERLLHPVFREFYAERDVVFEERRMRTESTPLGKFEETLNSIVWEAHPYHWPVVGWSSDIPAISKADADEFFATYYSPQNITLVLVGALDTNQTVRLVERYFGRIPSGTNRVPDVVTLEVKQPAEKRMNAEAEANPQVDILWHTAPFGHKDSYVLDVLARILSTRTGRLHKGLVLGREVATETWAQQDSRKWAGLFNVGAEVKDGHTPAEVEQGIYEELERLKNEEAPPEELQKVKNNFAAYEYRKLSANFPILIQLIMYDGLGDWREINEAGPKYQAVSVADLKRVAQTYLTKENRTVATYLRKAGAPAPAEEDPGLAGLNSEQRAALKRAAEQLKKETDAEKLKAALDQLEAQAGQAPPEMRGFLEVYARQIRERVAELEKGNEKP